MKIPFETHVSNENIKVEVKSTSQQSDFDPDAYLAEKEAQKSQGQAPKINELEVVRDEPHKIVHSDKPLEFDPKFTAEENAKFEKRYAEEKREASKQAAIQSSKTENDYVTDPALLAKLNATLNTGDGYVTDSALLAQLNTDISKPQQNIDYEAIAKEFGGTVRPVDYDAMAKKNSGKRIDTQTTKYTWSGGGKYDDKVIQYAKLVSSNFSVSAKDEQFVNKQYWPKKVKATLMPIGITVLSICGFFIFCWIIGWVVRGFTGISMGQDRKN